MHSKKCSTQLHHVKYITGDTSVWECVCECVWERERGLVVISPQNRFYFIEICIRCILYKHSNKKAQNIKILNDIESNSLIEQSLTERGMKVIFRNLENVELWQEELLMHIFFGLLSHIAEKIEGIVPNWHGSNSTRRVRILWNDNRGN